MEVSLIRSVGTVLRLERDAWSMVKWLRQATSEYARPPRKNQTRNIRTPRIHIQGQRSVSDEGGLLRGGRGRAGGEGEGRAEAEERSDGRRLQDGRPALVAREGACLCSFFRRLVGSSV